MSSRPSFVKKNTSSVEPLRERPKAQLSSHSTTNTTDSGGSLRSRSPGRSRPVAQNVSPHTSKEKSSRPQSQNRAPSHESPKRVSFNNDAKTNQDSKHSSASAKSRPVAKSNEKASAQPNKKIESGSQSKTKKENEKPSVANIPKVVVSSTLDDSKKSETELKVSSSNDTPSLKSNNDHKNGEITSSNISQSTLESKDKKDLLDNESGQQSPRGTMKSVSSSVAEVSNKSLPESKSPILARPVPVAAPVSDEHLPKSKHSKIKFKFPGKSKDKPIENPAPHTDSPPAAVMEVVTLPKDRVEVCIDKVLAGFTEVDRNLQRHVLSKLQGEVELNPKKPATLAVKTRYHRLKRLEGILGELNSEVVKMCDWFKKQEDLEDEIWKSIEQGLLKVEYVLHEMNKIWSSVFSGGERSIEDKMNTFHDFLDKLFNDLVEFVRKTNNLKLMKEKSKRIPVSNDKMAEIGMSFPMKYIDRGEEKKAHS